MPSITFNKSNRSKRPGEEQDYRNRKEDAVDEGFLTQQMAPRSRVIMCNSLFCSAREACSHTCVRVRKHGAILLVTSQNGILKLFRLCEGMRMSWDPI